MPRPPRTAITCICIVANTLNAIASRASTATAAADITLRTSAGAAIDGRARVLRARVVATSQPPPQPLR